VFLRDACLDLASDEAATVVDLDVLADHSQEGVHEAEHRPSG